MRILLVETSQYFPASPLFLGALENLSAQSEIKHLFFDESNYSSFLPGRLANKLIYRALAKRPLGYWAMNRDFYKLANSFTPDVILVVKGAHVSPSTLKRIREESKAVLVNFSTDDPFNAAANTKDIVGGIPYYDLYLCSKRAVMDDVLNAGAKQVEFMPFGYKPDVHYPENPTSEEEIKNFAADVVFIGGADRDRVPYFEELIRKLPNIKLNLYGGFWDRYKTLRGFHKGFAMGRDFRLALSGAKIAINLVRRANRDGHVMRSFEIPACGAFMLAERTNEHSEFYKEGVDFGGFSDPEDMAEKVNYYLNAKDQRDLMAFSGFNKVTTGNNTYTDRLKTILKMVDAIGLRA